ncbi:DNA translocase FtsK 4TM domain-containing protein [Huintestinicola sp.]|uniref:FtsK/SpoIIIE family DNA translocase n=1 Tax=Huintestinicola sp. TaxID=2981661 RepID=UPI003D7D204F
MAAPKKASSSGKSRSTTKGRTTKAEQEAKRANDRVLWSTVIFAAGILILAFLLFEGESAWLAIHNIILGLFGVGAVLVPPILIYASVMISKDTERETVSGKVAQGILLVLLCCAVIQIFFSEPIDPDITLGKLLTDLFEDGKAMHGGGLFSAVIALPLLKLFGKTGAAIIVIILAFVFTMLLANKTIVDVFRAIKNIFAAADAARPEYEEVEEFVPPPGAKKQPKKAVPASSQPNLKKVPNADVPEAAAEEKRKEFNIDIPLPFGKKKAAEAAKAVEEKPAEAAAEPEKPKSAVELEADAIARSVEENEAQRQAAKAAAANEAKAAANEAESKQDDLASIIKKAVKPAAKGEPAPVSGGGNEPARSSGGIPLFKKNDKVKGSTLASNKIGDDEDLDMPETTAQDIQNEIAENVTAPAEYVIPPMDLLKKSSNELNAEEAEAEMKQNADTLVETLKSFGVMTRIVDIHRGPTVTRYELQPNAGVKISKITGLADDIALNLAAAGVRIQAPIPGKAAVGIEVPNKIKDIVTLRDVIDTEEFRNAESKLTFAVGKNIDGEIILGDIAKLPHVIIAGTTGSGKSVCTNGIIMSILYNATPDEVRLVLIDPKVVEFKIYDGIPHLLIPVVTDPRKAAGALAWAVQEMLKRYKLFADNNVRDLKGYNEMAAETEGVEPLPRIVIVIDELADLMMAAAGEVEDSICRLAQMARAAGMHLIIATQRPTVDVITGLIKANIPSRIALKVASGIDSRSIINEIGAEKLLGNGDLLYFPTGYAKPVRVQNCFTSDKEVTAVVNFIKNGAGDVTYSDDIMKEIEQNIPQPKGEKERPADNDKSYDNSDDKIIESAIECAVDAGGAGVSVSYFQRKLKLGYARAARIMDELEELGVVGPFEGAKPRQVLMTREMFLQRKLSGNGGGAAPAEVAEDDVPFEE